MDTPVERLRAWLDQHHLIGGGRLPAERSLAVLLGCSRRQLRSALAALDGDGQLRQPSARTRVVAGPITPGDLGDSVIVLASPADLPAAGSERYQGLYQRLYSAVQDALAAAGLRQMVLPADAQMRERVCQVVMRRPAGILVLFAASREPGGQELLDSARRAGVPAVVCGDHLSSAEVASCGTAVVGFDHAAAVAAMVARAVTDGHRRLLRVRGWNPAIASCSWRDRQEQGWSRGLAAHGLHAPETVEVPIPDEGAPLDHDHHRPRILAGYLAEHLLGSEPVEAILAASDSLVPELGLACRLLGRQAALYGYDHMYDHPVLAARMTATGIRPLVTVDPNPAELARMAVSLLRTPAGPGLHLSAMRLV